MASFILLKAEVKPLTRAVAEQFRDMEASPTERELNPSRMKHLKEKAEAGQLVTFHWATAKMKDKVLRMNGQHSSTMLCDLPDPFPEGLQVHLDQYEVDGPDGLAQLFRQFDDRKSGRSANDVAGAYQNIYEELHDVVRPVAKLGIEGSVWYRSKVEHEFAPTGDEQYTLFHETGLHPFLLWLNDVFSIKTPELKRKEVVAAMYATFTRNAIEARKFWDQVARGGDDFEDNAASTVLDAWLKTAKEREQKNEKTKLAGGDFYQGSIYAWNAYRERKTIKDIRHDAKKGWYQPVE